MNAKEMAEKRRKMENVKKKKKEEKKRKLLKSLLNGTLFSKFFLSTIIKY